MEGYGGQPERAVEVEALEYGDWAAQSSEVVLKAAVGSGLVLLHCYHHTWGLHSASGDRGVRGVRHRTRRLRAGKFTEKGGTIEAMFKGTQTRAFTHTHTGIHTQAHTHT